MKHLVRPTWTWSKRLIMIGFILPVVLVLAFVGAVSVLDFNQYKPQIETTLSEQMGQNVTVKGSVEVSLYPFAFSLGQFSVSQPELSKEKSEVESPAWLSIRTVRAELDLWAFLSEKRVHVKGLELIEPQLVWRMEGRPDGDQTLINNRVGDTRGNKFVKALSDWHLKTLVITDGAVEFHNQAMQHHAKMADINILAMNMNLQHPFRIRADLRYLNVLKGRQYDFDLSGVLSINPNLLEWRLHHWQGIFNLALPVELQIPMMRVETQGKEFILDIGASKLSADSLSFNSLGTEIQSSFVGNYGDQANLYGRFNIKKLGVRKWSRHIGASLPNFLDKDALKTFSSNFDWQIDHQGWSLNNLSVAIDDSHLRGRIWLEGVTDRPELQFDLTADKLNLDRYQALAETVKSSSDTKTGPIQLNYLPLWDGLSGITKSNLKGHLFAKQVIWQGLTIEELDAHVATPEENVLEVAPLDANLYQGELNSKLSFKFSEEQTDFAWSGQLAAVKLASLLKDGLGKKPLSGLSHLHFNLQGQVASRFEWKQNLSGSVTLRSNQGSVYGLDLPKLLAGTSLQSTDRTAFDSLLIKGDLRKGRLKTKQFKLRSPQLFGNGVGEFDLVSHQANTQMQLRLQKLSGDAKPYQGMLLPMQISGDLSLPSWSVDKAALKKARSNPKKKVEALLKVLP